MWNYFQVQKECFCCCFSKWGGISISLLQRQQKKVTEENSIFFDILQKALPAPTPEETPDSPQQGADDGPHTSNSSNHTVSNHHSSSQSAAVSVEHHQPHSGGGKSGNKISPKSSNGSNSKTSQKSQSSSSSRHRPNTGLRSSSSSQESKDSSLSKSSDPGSPTGASGSVPNGDLPPRPPSAGKVHLPTGKKQATVKAVPRVDQPPTTLHDKVGLGETKFC